MKTQLAAACTLFAGVFALEGCIIAPESADAPPPAPPPSYAQQAPGEPPPPAPPAYAPDSAPQPPASYPAVPVSALETLVAPIALYPDPLVAIILPASTVPGDIAAAQDFAVQYGDATRIDGQAWDPSVRALAHYPALLSWLAANPQWTQALGSAFLQSPSDVMGAIQRVRSRAVAAGTLAPSPQQQVIVSDQDVQILPAQADAIYLPSYDASAFYGDQGYSALGPVIEYGPPCAIGEWLSFGLDWSSGGIWVGGASTWRSNGQWHRPYPNGQGHQVWRPRPGAWNPKPGAWSQQGPARNPASYAPAPIRSISKTVQAGSYHEFNGAADRGPGLAPEGGARQPHNGTGNAGNSHPASAPGTPSSYGQRSPSTEPAQRPAEPRANTNAPAAPSRTSSPTWSPAKPAAGTPAPVAPAPTRSAPAPSPSRYDAPSRPERQAPATPAYTQPQTHYSAPQSPAAPAYAQPQPRSSAPQAPAGQYAGREGRSSPQPSGRGESSGRSESSSSRSSPPASSAPAAPAKDKEPSK